MVGVGVTGELYLSGAQVARGYIGSPELTRAAFDAMRGPHGERMYRTGDRARWWGRDGMMEFVGRVDFQVS